VDPHQKNAILKGTMLRPEPSDHASIPTGLALPHITASLRQ
jgi:hypothetical protein